MHFCEMYSRSSVPREPRRSWRRMMTSWPRKCLQFRIASLLILLAVSAVVFAVLFSGDDLEQSLRRDLGIAKSATLELVSEGTHTSPFQERYAWILVKTGSRFELIGTVRPLDESMPWRIPNIMISWIEGQAGTDPFHFVFNSRPSKAKIDYWIRYSEDFW